MLFTYHDLSSLLRINPANFPQHATDGIRALKKEEIKKSREITLSTQHPAM